MARIVADTNDLRATAAALRTAAGTYNEISLLVGGITDPWALPTAMRGRVQAFEAQIVGEARHLASTAGASSARLDRIAAAFEGVGGGTWGGAVTGPALRVSGGLLGGSCSVAGSPHALTRLDNALDDAQSAITDFGWNLLGGVREEARRIASEAGRQMHSASQKVRSQAGRVLRGARTLAPVMRGIPVLGAGVGLMDNISQGRSPLEAVTRTAISTTVSTGMGLVAAALIPTGVGAPVSIVLVGASGTAGDVASDRIGDWIFGTRDRSAPRAGGGGGGW